MTEKEQQFNQWFDQYANGVKVFEEADMKQAYLQGRADLEKENAELKEKLKPENCLKSLAKSGLVKFTCENGNEHDQLTKAKEIIKKLIEAIHIWDCKNLEEVEAEAEQFLKGEEE